MKILNIGSLNIDYVYQVDHMVAPGETLMASKRDVYCGGKGLNQSIAMSRAGLQVNHAGCIGAEGMMLTDLLKENDVNVDAVEVLMESTGHAIIQVDTTGQNCILLYGGANRLLTKEYIDDVLKDYGENDILLLQNEVNNLDYIIDSAYEKKMKIILNPSPYDSALDACDMTKISLFLLNEVEGKQMTGYDKPEDILTQLSKIYPNAEVVLTLGENGSVYQCEGKRYAQKAYSVDAIDTTAAGDTFTGYFIAGMVEGKSPKECLDLAAKASSIAVTRQGAAPSIPYRNEVM